MNVEPLTVDSPFPFGKYKGQPLALALSDSSYMQWVGSQVGIAERYPALIELIANGVNAKNYHTPEHNSMQIKFLNREYVTSMVKSMFEKRKISNVELLGFERYGWDVLIRAEHTAKYGPCFNVEENATYKERFNVLVELKPSISEDYPTILRQVSNRIRVDNLNHNIRRHNGDPSIHVVLTDSFNAKTATVAQVKSMFSTERIKLGVWSNLMDCFL